MTSVEISTLPRRMRPWSSVVRSHVIEIEYVAVDAHTERELFHLDLELNEPLPEELEEPQPEDPLTTHEYHLSLSWPFGGIWKIRRWSKDRKSVHCQSWRTADTSKKKQMQSQDTKSPHTFDWKMQLCKWKDDDAHWIVRDIHPPKNSGRVRRGLSEGLMTDEDLAKAPVLAQLLTNFAPLQVQIKVNNITSVETVNQNFSADVTWTVKLPAITAIREDSVIRELIDTLEIAPDQFEFTNVSSILEERPIATSHSIGEEVYFTDPTLALMGQAAPIASVKLHDLRFSRRVIALFSEEMSMYYFPFDQQKLSFDFSTGGGVRPWVRLMPASVDAGKFEFENYKLGNVFDAVFEEKVFVARLDRTGMKKHIRFELMLERRSGYYLTNVAIPAACITYLCFITYAPLSDGALMETDARLQIVLTLLLTAVTFKNQVAALIPQVSYFTWIDNYVFFCFVVTCLVALENALFPMIRDWFPNVAMSEHNLLGISFGLFTLVNAVWGLFIMLYLRRRRFAARILLQIHELSLIVSKEVPCLYREEVFHRLIDSSRFPSWSRPPLSVSQSGDVFVELPDDSPHDTDQKEKRLKRTLRRNAGKQAAEGKRDEVKEIYRQVNPSASVYPMQSPLGHITPGVGPSALEAGDGRHSRVPSYSPSALSDGGGAYQRMK